MGPGFAAPQADNGVAARARKQARVVGHRRISRRVDLALVKVVLDGDQPFAAGRGAVSHCVGCCSGWVKGGEESVLEEGEERGVVCDGNEREE